MPILLQVYTFVVLTGCCAIAIALLDVPQGTPGYPLAGGVPHCRPGYPAESWVVHLECKLI
jgi:hypothetical protein